MPVDYAKLAAQHGGTPQANDDPPAIDYAALARETGGMAESAAPQDWSQRLGLHAPTSSRVLGFLRGAGTAAVDMAEGAASGLASTVYHGGDLIRRATGQERIIDQPDVQQAMHAPENIQGTIGRYGEQAAEFAVPLAKVAGATRGLSAATRLGAESAASAGVAGVQSGGDPVTMGAAAVLPPVGRAVGAVGGMAVRKVRDVAAAANEGGIGGALASAVRSGGKPDSIRMIIQAVKPRNTRLGFEKAAGMALDEVAETAAQSGKPITSLDDLIPAIKASKLRVRAQYDAMAGPKRAMGSTVDLTPVADAMEASIPKKVALQSPGQAEGIKTMASAYRDRFKLDDAEQLLRETNAELQAYYNKFPAAQRASELTNPEIAHLVAQGKALRTAIYSTLDDPGQGAAAREVQKRYGALMELEDATLRRANVANRQQPESLSEQIGKVRAAADMARGAWKIAHGNLTGAADIAAAHAGKSMATYLKEQQTSDMLIRRAFAAHTGRPSAIAMPTQRPIAGYLGRGSIITPEPADPSSVEAIRAARGFPVRDPATGRWKRVYTSEVEAP